MQTAIESLRAMLHGGGRLRVGSVVRQAHSFHCGVRAGGGELGEGVKASSQRNSFGRCFRSSRIASESKAQIQGLPKPKP